MEKINMKVIGREKVEIGRDTYSTFYLVQFPDFKDKYHLHTTYFGNGERGILDSFLNLTRRYENGWESEKLEDLRNAYVPVPAKVRDHILQLMELEDKTFR